MVVVTEWDEFRGLSLRDLARRMRGNALLDFRNIYGQREAERAGLRHFGIGRGRNSSTPGLAGGRGRWET